MARFVFVSPHQCEGKEARDPPSSSSHFPAFSITRTAPSAHAPPATCKLHQFQQLHDTGPGLILPRLWHGCFPLPCSVHMQVWI